MNNLSDETFTHRADEVTTPVAGGYLVDRDPGDEHAEAADVYPTVVLTDAELDAIDAHFPAYVEYLQTPEADQDELTRRAILDALLLTMDRNRLLDDFDALDERYEEHLDALSADDADQIATLQTQLDQERARTAAQRRELDDLAGLLDLQTRKAYDHYAARVELADTVFELRAERDAYKARVGELEGTIAAISALSRQIEAALDAHFCLPC